MELNVTANRRAAKYGRRELVARVLWWFVRPLFRLSPRACFAWRNWILRCLGARIGRHVRFENSVRIQYPWMLEVGDYSAVGERVLIYNVGRVTIGKRVTLSHQSQLCAGTHDYNSSKMPLRRSPITIGDDAWICADAFVGPGVIIYDGAVVGARAATFQNVESWAIVGGNPARRLKTRTLDDDGERSRTS
jgi:putative colanic acid biosynthesis acetyltransferase WcaF